MKSQEFSTHTLAPSSQVAFYKTRGGAPEKDSAQEFYQGLGYRAIQYLLLKQPSD